MTNKTAIQKQALIFFPYSPETKYRKSKTFLKKIHLLFKQNEISGVGFLHKCTVKCESCLSLVLISSSILYTKIYFLYYYIWENYYSYYNVTDYKIRNITGTIILFTSGVYVFIFFQTILFFRWLVFFKRTWVWGHHCQIRPTSA